MLFASSTIFCLGMIEYILPQAAVILIEHSCKYRNYVMVVRYTVDSLKCGKTSIFRTPVYPTTAIQIIKAPV